VAEAAAGIRQLTANTSITINDYLVGSPSRIKQPKQVDLLADFLYRAAGSVTLARNPELPTYHSFSQISTTLGARYVSSTGGNLFRLVCLRYGLQGMRNLSTMVGMESDWIVFERLGCQMCSTPACSV
jgi:hypothetical protein